MNMAEDIRLARGEEVDAIKAELALKANKADVDEIANNVGPLRNYSTAPTKIGTWIDGTPVWRCVFEVPVGALERADKCVPVPLPVKDTDAAFVINAWGQTGFSGHPNLIDDYPLRYAGQNLFEPFESGAICEDHDSFYGYYEFVTSEDNIKTS